MTAPERPPGGCRWCGITERQHYQRWTAAAGWHQWTPPTDEQRLARMRDRRGDDMSEPTTSGRCALCQRDVPTAELVSHIAVHHPDHYGPFETWPDGGVVIEYDESAITPEGVTEEHP